MSAFLGLPGSLRLHTLGNIRQRSTPLLFFEPLYPIARLGPSRHGLGRTAPQRHVGSYRRGGSFPRDYSRINTYILYGFMGLNVSVFAYYQLVSEQARQGYPQKLLSFVRNFTLNVNTFKDEGRWWTAVTSVFTHFGLMHLAANLLSMYYFGRLVTHTPGIGPLRLITLVIGSGVAGSIGQLYIRMNAMKQQHTAFDRRRALGFSGAVMGVGAVAACFYPTTTFLIYGIVPVPLWGLMLGYGLYDGYFLGSENTTIAHAGHVGGLAFGVLYYLARLRGIIPMGI